MPATNPALIEAMVPFYLMPVAALLGLYILYALSRTLYVLYNNVDPEEVQRAQVRDRLKGVTAKPQITWQSREFAILILSLILSVIAYSFVVARVEAGYQRAEYRSFDPYALLGLTKPTASTTAAGGGGGGGDVVTLEASVVQEAFKKVVALHKAASSDEEQLDQLKLAYTALSDERASLNYQRFGHPMGPLEVAPFSLQIPVWLRSPPVAGQQQRRRLISGGMMVYMVYLVALLGAVYAALSKYRELQQTAKQQQQEQQKSTKEAEGDLLDSSNSVSKQDLSFLINHLKPDSTHMEILWTICATPDNVAWSLRNVASVEKARKERLQEKQEKAAAPEKKDHLAAMLDEGGWDEDDEDEDPAAAAQAKRERELQNRATGQTPQVLLEGIDDGVLGQEWVEQTLAKHKQWPPKTVDMFKEIEYNGAKIEKVLDHPGLRRILCMTMGRLNSQMLNSHPQLLQAGAKKMIDQTYFRASLEFRQRIGLLLEGALRVSMMLRSYRLVAKIIETVALFRIGCQHNPNSVRWFQAMMQKSNGCLPSLQIHTSQIVSVGYTAEDPIGTDDVCECQLDLERTHAEQFTKAKVAMCQKQGIPPQAALQGYREGWWLLLRCQRVDGPTPAQEMNMQVLNDLEMGKEAQELFGKEAPEEQLVSAIPLMVGNIAQKRGQFQLKFKAPDVPGKYKFTLSVKSQDFLGADQNLTLTTDVVDASKVERKPKKEEEEKEKTEEEPKKDK